MKEIESYQELNNSELAIFIEEESYPDLSDIRVHEGDLIVEDNYRLFEDSEKYSLYITGNLIVSGTIGIGLTQYRRSLLVGGNLRAKNFINLGGDKLFVGDNFIVDGISFISTYESRVKIVNTISTKDLITYYGFDDRTKYENRYDFTTNDFKLFKDEFCGSQNGTTIFYFDLLLNKLELNEEYLDTKKIDKQLLLEKKKLMKQEKLMKQIYQIKFDKGDTFEKTISVYNTAFKEVLTLIEDEFLASDEFKDDFDEHDLEDYVDRHPLGLTYPIKFNGEKIGEEKINAIENKLDISLPPSYKQFLKTNGLLFFGDKYEKPYSMIPISKIDRLYDTYFTNIEENELNDLKKEYPGLKELTDKLIVFADGDETRQGHFHVCFNYHSLNEETGEMDVFFFDQSDWPKMFECIKAEPTKETSMDSYARQASHIMFEHYSNY